MVETGGARAEFWCSTLREIALDLEVANDRRRDDERVRRWHTWHIAALPLLKTFPEFEKFDLPPDQPKAAGTRQTTEQQIAIARQWTVATSRPTPSRPNQ